jgi:23S rRNA (guanosine2251-2'-O)-methyltransferase
MDDFELIIGIHSIVCALNNPNRVNSKLYATEDGLSEVKKQVKNLDIDIQLCSSHKLQELAKNYFKDLELEYQRVPTGVFLISEPVKTVEIDDFYERVANSKNLKILCLDQISDVHNAGAIVRSASFYGIDFIIIPDKKSFGLTPSFFRIASGAAEFVPFVRVNKLTKTISKLISLDTLCIALSEHATGELSEFKPIMVEKNTCLVLGKEDTGISNAVLRLIDNKISLTTQGDIKSLNVSNAAAITMEKCFGNI